ncbi:MAG: hypothetical protein K8R92_12405 [Planctomycetes bacterium]|nr:hypothetical protein [Planctomycetota bacterium]
MIQNRFSFLASSALLIATAAFAVAGNQGIKANVPGPKIGGIAGAAIDPIDPETIRDRFAREFPGGGLLDIEGSLRRVYGVTFSTGVSPSDSADKFMRDWSMLWKVPYSQLEKVGPFEDGAHTLPLVASDDGESSLFTAAYFRQQAGGVPVFRSLVWGLVRNEDSFPMVLAGGTLRDIGNIEDQIAGQDLDIGHINIGAIGGQAFSTFRAAPSLISSPRYVIWAGLDEDVQVARLAVEFSATGGGDMDPDNYEKMLFVVDASTGDILYQESLIYHGSVSGQINEFVTSDHKADTCSAETTRGMPYAKVVIGGTTFYADVNGAFSGTYAGTGNVTVAPTMAGKYFTVTPSTGSLITVSSQSVANGGTATFTFNAGAANAATTTAQTNTYEMANRARDICVAAAPSYPTVSTQTGFIIRPNSNAGTCNAFYDGNINFYLAGGGCNNSGFGDVVAHEYGHHLVQVAGSGQSQYGEGMGDCVGVLVTDISALGVGFQSCASGIRNASNTCQYSAASCSSCGSEIHSCGQLISGCVWNLRNSFAASYPADYRTRLAYLVINSMPLHAGSSTIQNDITIDYLTLNDTNGSLLDGTPDYFAIAAAFNAHGLTAPALSLFTITLPSGAPTTIDPAGGTTMNVLMTPVSGSVLAGSEKLFYKDSAAGVYSFALLTPTGTNTYQATFPAAICNSTMQFYVQATATTGGTIITLPASGGAGPFSATAAISASTLISDDFEGASTSFTIGAAGDTATAGTWFRGPGLNGCGGPTTSYSGTKAFITAQGSCVDVDNGKTTLLSPIVDASTGDTVELSYAIYLSYNGATPSDDPLEVFISNDGGSNWVLAASYTTATAWSLKHVNVLSFLPATNQMRVKWVAQDNGSDNVVEAGVDSVTFKSVLCSAAVFGDLDGDGIVDGADLGLMLLDFGPCPGCPSDLDGSGEVDGGDIGLLLLNFT